MAAKRNGLKRAVTIACTIVRLAARYQGKAETQAATITTAAGTSGSLLTCIQQFFAAASCVCAYKESSSE